MRIPRIIWHRYGLQQREISTRGSHCAATCKSHGPKTHVDPTEFATGAHVLSCQSCGRLHRHNLLLAEISTWFLETYGVALDRDTVQLHLNDGSRVDGVLLKTLLSQQALSRGRHCHLW